MMNPGRQNAEVLVVGAGPTGLVMAADLARRGALVRIIDKAPGPSVTSKALGIHAGTLESLERGFGPGIVQEMIQAGNQAREAFIHINGKKPVRVDFSAIESRYNSVLILEQSITEKLLLAELEKQGVRVERGSALVSLRQSPDEVSAMLKSSEGQEETLISRFVIGCDGAHSAVRHQVDFSFSGDAYTGTFILGDVEITWPWRYDSIRTFLSANGVMACFPMKGERKYRLILIPKGEPPAEGAEIGLDEFTRIARRLCPQVSIGAAFWLTRFKVHHRIASSFQRQRVFLAGDAAHIHSPAGGQGMNTGIQDALNLSPKLILALRGGASAGLLEWYERERIPVAKAVLRNTDRAFRLALLPETLWLRLARAFLIPWLLRTRFIQRRVVRALSQVAIARREIARRG